MTDAHTPGTNGDDRPENAREWAWHYLTLPWTTAAVVIVGFFSYASLFAWRNCEVTIRTTGAEKLFTPPDGMFGYGLEALANVFEKVTSSGLSRYAWSQGSLDMAFPLFYTSVLIVVLRWVIPPGKRFKALAWIVPILAGVADALENLTLILIVKLDLLGTWVTYVASGLTLAKWVFILAALAMTVFGFLFWDRKRSRALLQHLFFTRVPVLLGAITLGLAVMGGEQTCTADAAPPVGLATVQNLLTLDNGAQVFWAVFCILVSCTVIIFCGTHLWRLAHMRIGTETYGLKAVAADDWDTRVKFALSGLALAVPLLWRLELDGPGTAIGSGVAGALLAVAVLFVVLKVREWLTRKGHDSGNASEDEEDMEARARRGAAKIQRKVARSLNDAFGPGFEIGDSGVLYRGHALAFAVFVVLAFGYLIAGPLFDPTGPLPDYLDLPAIGYAVLLLALLSMLFSSLTFLLDRPRVPVLLAVIIWAVAWGSLPLPLYDTQHYFDVTFVPEGEDGPPRIEKAVEKRSTATGNTDGPIVVIAAAGGGIQAAAWTAEVLEGLHVALEREFIDSIYLVSATSGGSVGVYFFIEALRAEAEAGKQGTLWDERALDRSRYTGFKMNEQVAQNVLSTRQRRKTVDFLREVPKASQASSLEATAWGFMFPDFRRFAAPFLAGTSETRTQRDRAWAIEQAWHRWRTCMTTDTTARYASMEANPDCRLALSSTPPPARLSDWWRGAADGTLPGVILNGTIIENGEQFLASSLDLRALDLSRDSRATFAGQGRWTFGGYDPALCEHYPDPSEQDAEGAPARMQVQDAKSVRSRPGMTRDLTRAAKAGTSLDEPDPCATPTRFVDMRAVTAARLSATFPYVTPVARARVRHDDSDYEGGENVLAPDEPTADRGAAEAETLLAWHVGDGGYYDNPGSVAALRWMRAVRDEERRSARGIERPIIFIQINPFPARSTRKEPKEGRGWKAALLGPLTAMLSVRTSSQLARSDLELAMLEDKQLGCFEAVEFRPPYVLNRAEPPLSWELSKRDRKRLRSDWLDPSNQTTVEYLKREYFDGRRKTCD